MKYGVLLSLLIVVILGGCGPNEIRTIKNLPEGFKPESIDVKGAAKQWRPNEVSDHLYDVHFSADAPAYKFLISHDETFTYFRVFKPVKKEWEEVFFDYGGYSQEETYSVGVIYPPQFNSQKEHVFVYRQSDKGGEMSYFALGEKNNKIQILIDNDFGEDANTIYMGDYNVTDGGLSIYENGRLFKNYVWFSDSEEYR